MPAVRPGRPGRPTGPGRHSSYGEPSGRRRPGIRRAWLATGSYQSNATAPTVRSCGDAYTASMTRRGIGRRVVARTRAHSGPPPAPAFGAVRAQRGIDPAQRELPGVLRGERGVVQGAALVDVTVDVGGRDAGQRVTKGGPSPAGRSRKSTTSSCCRPPAPRAAGPRWHRRRARAPPGGCRERRRRRRRHSGALADTRP